ncbi:MAG TPA: ABC transporter permease [Gemmatimonadaceae bacterium]|nr:ABC transporter permease [Gemmatimonadaceae bacterium]
MNRTARFALGGLILLALASWLVPLISPADPLAIGDIVGQRLLPPGSRGADGNWHLLGTDRFGRDLFTRMMLAGRISLAIGVGGSLLAAAIGVLIGAGSGWLGGAIDRALMALADTMLSVPRLVLLLLCAALWQPGVATVVFVLAATGWMGVARIVRGEVLGVRERPYVDAARTAGAPDRRLLFRYVLPNVLGPAIVAATLGVGNAILLEAGLAFLGLGVQPPHPSWGNLIAGGRDLIVNAPWVAVAPGLALIVTVCCCTLLGDAMRDRLAGEQLLGERA